MSKLAITPDLEGQELPDTPWSGGWRDAVLYAFGIGAKIGPGALVDQDDEEGDLDFLYERRGPKVYPTYAVIPGMLALGQLNKVIDLDVGRLLHGEQSILLHRPFPASGELVVKGKIVDVFDKGHAAVLGVESTLVDDDGPIATTYASLFAKGYGGFGGSRGPSQPVEHKPPERDPDHVFHDTVCPEQAAMYRLSGDRVPLHIDPAFARKAGYPGPFLHGLCSYGFAGRALVKMLCDNQPERLTSMTGRFSGLVWMNDQLITKVWEIGSGEVIFQTETQSGAAVITHAHASIKDL